MDKSLAPLFHDIDSIRTIDIPDGEPECARCVNRPGCQGVHDRTFVCAIRWELYG